MARRASGEWRGAQVGNAALQVRNASRGRASARRRNRAAGRRTTSTVPRRRAGARGRAGSAARGRRRAARGAAQRIAAEGLAPGDRVCRAGATRCKGGKSAALTSNLDPLARGRARERGARGRPEGRGSVAVLAEMMSPRSARTPLGSSARLVKKMRKTPRCTTSRCREVLMLLMMLLVGVQVGRMLEFDYRAITARHQETLPAMAKLPGYKLRIHPDEASRMPRSTRTSAEALAQSVLAWWSPELDEVRANVVARLSSLEYELEMCSDNRWCDVSAGNDRTCRVCRYGTDECYVGTVAVTMAPEENVPMNEDRGTWSHFKAFKEAFKSDLIYERYPLRTVHLRCIFASPIKRVLPFEHYELRHDYGFDGRSPQTLRVGHVPDRGADMIKDKPVVCGRVLFDQVYGKSIAYFVENNVQHGIATTIMYEVGTSRIKDRAVLDTYKREGSLVIVDLRDVFQDHYGIWSRWIVWNTKAFLQSFTRKDCLDRVSPLQPSWVGFLDLDEYLTANIFQSVRPDINIMQLFMLAPVDDEGREDTRFCNAPPEEKVVVGGKAKTGLTKLFVRPNVPYTSIKVHWIDILTHVYNERDLPHVRVIQPSEAFLYHVRCANLGMS